MGEVAQYLNTQHALEADFQVLGGNNPVQDMS
jgi:hypothetical protein